MPTKTLKIRIEEMKNKIKETPEGSWREKIESQLEDIY